MRNYSYNFKYNKMSSELNRTNQHRLVPLSLHMMYESADIIASLSLPRKYICNYNNISQNLHENFISIGHNYGKYMPSTEEPPIIGEWTETAGKLEIHLEVSINAENRNDAVCDRLGIVLEGIAFAETALLKLHPNLAATKIFIKFHSTNQNHDRIEYWHRLGYWTQDCMKDNSNNLISSQKQHRDIGISDHKHDKINNHENRKHKERVNQRRPPLMCPACKK